MFGTVKIVSSCASSAAVPGTGPCSLLAQPLLVSPWLIGQHFVGARRLRFCPCLFLIHGPDNDDDSSLLQLGYVVFRRNVIVDRDSPQLLFGELAYGNLLPNEKHARQVGCELLDLRQPVHAV